MIGYFEGRNHLPIIELKRSTELSQRNAAVDPDTVACALRCASQVVGRDADGGPRMAAAAVHDALSWDISTLRQGSS